MTDADIDAIVDEALEEIDDEATCIYCGNLLDEYEMEFGFCDDCAEELEMEED